MARVVSVLGAWAVLVTVGVAQPPAGEVAITFDDLPFVSVIRRDLPASRTLTTRLLAAITAHHVPAIGFVNEDKLRGEGASDAGRVALLRSWLDAGLELGNHSYSHPDMHTTPLAAFEDDVVQGESVLRPLLAERGRTPRFFRHPFLHTGRDLAERAQFDRFLADRGYRVAPVTIDNDDYVFAAAYDRASARGAMDVRQRVADAYVPYMEAKFAFFERNTMELFGRNMKHVLLLHANALNADRFGALAQMLERRGYRCITLDEALQDPAYRSADTYAGSGGITWLHRWALTKGMPKSFFAGEPEVPPFVADNARP